MVSTRKHLVLSYVSRNDRTDDELNPSSIIQTLVDELDSGYLKNKFEKIQHPLKAYSLSYFPELTDSERENATPKSSQPNYDPAAFRQARVFRTRELFDQEFSDTKGSAGFQRISPEWLSPEVIQVIAENDLQPAVPESSTENNLHPVSFTHLRKFLESPLQSTASQLLRLDEDEEERDDIIDEPLVLERLSEWSLLRKVWDNALTLPENSPRSAEQPEWEGLYHLQAQRMELEGEMPSGIFRGAMQTRHLRILKSWQKQLCIALEIDWPGLKKNLRQYHLGPVQEGTFDSGLTESHQLFPALCLKNENSAEADTDINETKFYGKTEWWYTDESENWHVIYLSERESKDKSWLRHFLDVLIL
ncbi:MAG: exodeoxyribonuclease V subunit gamma, partial [SAR324 cluster bacterium]|nr:exodeoxyribonuclease V subunit gamma [SAR324 cluster bacterium]